MHPNYRPAAKLFTILIFICLLAGTGCSSLLQPATSSPTLETLPISTVTPTIETPIIYCTPPFCWEDEVFHCPGKCPGGCGTTCATRTPDPLASPTPTFPPPTSICTFPPPAAGQFELRIDLCASAVQVHTGDTIQLAAAVSEQAQVSFIDVTGKDADGSGFFSVRTRPGDHQPVFYNSNAHLDLVMLQTHNHQIYALLNAKSPGAIKIEFQVIPTVPDLRASITIIVE